MDNKDFQTILIKRLNTLISLTLEVASSNKGISISEKIGHLRDMGLTPAEIGQIVGKNTNYISAVIHKKKRGAKRKGTKHG